MNEPTSRIYHIRAASPFEAGRALGEQIGPRMEANIQHYIQRRPDPPGSLDLDRLRSEALPWLRRLPPRFRDELEGLAAGAGLPLQRVAEWVYTEACLENGCSGAVVNLENRLWVARNNDTYVPELWGFATIREIAGRIPTVCFGLEGDVFTPTGINRERLWLHYHYLPVWDAPRPGAPALPGYAFLVEALETCRSLADVERLLSQVDRTGGMLLFAVDGKTETFAVYECTCARHYRRTASNGWIAGTNHYCACPDPQAREDPASDSAARFQRMDALVQALANRPRVDLPGDLIRILGDEAIERRGEPFATAYANVACPGTGELWYTFGGYPAASRGSWGQLDWPWPD